MIRRYWIVLLVSITFLLPMDSIAQKPIKRKKKENTEQTTPAKKPNKPSSSNQSSSKPQSVKVSNPDGTIAGYGYVDLGLPSGLKWATCNVGATSASGYGDYFAWGETRTKSSYTDDNSLTYGRSMSELRSAGIIGSDGNLTMSYDAARANWGGSWRMPTKAECEELVGRCTWTRTTQGGHKGYKVTGPNGKSIFLPASGCRRGSSLNLVGESGLYWSSSPYEGNASYAYGIFFDGSGHYVGCYTRGNGRSVRPVSE